MAMNLNNLKIFIHVADSGNLTRAAEALYISQPAVSKAIRSIEEELGVSLFYRDKKTGVQLTDVGERVLYFARQMMLMEEKIHQTAYLSRNMLEGTLKIASLPIGVERILVKALARFKEQYPQVEVEILEGSTNEVNAMVDRNEAEFGISLYPAEGFQSEKLLEDKIIAISRDPISENVIRLNESTRQFLICQAAMEVTRSVLKDPSSIPSHFKVTGAATVRRMVQAGLGVGIQSALLVEPEKQLFLRYPVEPEIRTDVVMIAKNFQDLSPAAEKFVALIRSLD